MDPSRVHCSPSLGGSTVPHSPATMAGLLKRFGNQDEDTYVVRDKEEADKDDGEGLINSAPETPRGEFLRFIPSNEAAKLAFHELVVQSKDGHLDQHHAQYINIQGKGFLSDEEGYDQGSSGEGTSADSHNEAQGKPKEIHRGHFAINFKHSAVAKGGKWAIGKGSRRAGSDRNVDLLLAAPRSSYRRNLAPTHAFLRMNTVSGAWMISAGEICSHNVGDADGSQCLHTPVLLDGIPIRHGNFTCISRPRTPFIVGGLHYIIYFTVKDLNSEESYLVDRDRWLDANDLPIPNTSMSGIPFDSDIRTQQAIFRRGLGSGTFGTVFEGFDPGIGDVRAIKKMTIKSAAAVPEIESEVQAHEAFTEHTGIVRFYGFSNSLGQASFGPFYPLEIYMVMKKGNSFLDTFVTNSLAIDQIRQKKLCKQLLQGLVAIHEKGWMHRDITPMNILYFSQDPEHAALCDFGKLCRTRTDTVTTLAGWKWLPPEIKKNRREIYDQKIDVWMLGHALLFCWYHSYQTGKTLRESKDYHAVIDLLKNENSLFLLLIAKMLSWNVKHRPSAQDALNDLSLQDTILDEVPKSRELSRKRAPPKGDT